MVSERVNMAIKTLTKRIGIGDLLPGLPMPLPQIRARARSAVVLGKACFWAADLAHVINRSVLPGHKAWAWSVTEKQTVPNYLADRAQKNDRPCPVIR